MGGGGREGEKGGKGEEGEGGEGKGQGWKRKEQDPRTIQSAKKHWDATRASQTSSWAERTGTAPAAGCRPRRCHRHRACRAGPRTTRAGASGCCHRSPPHPCPKCCPWTCRLAPSGSCVSSPCLSTWGEQGGGRRGDEGGEGRGRRGREGGRGIEGLEWCHEGFSGRRSETAEPRRN